MREAGADRLGIDIAHQAPDVLHLPASRLVFGDRARLFDRIGKALGQGEIGQPLHRQLHQGFAQVLKFVHPGFAARFRQCLPFVDGTIVGRSAVCIARRRGAAAGGAGSAFLLSRSPGCFVGSSHGGGSAA